MTTSVAIEAQPKHRMSVWERVTNRVRSWGATIKRGLVWLKDRAVRAFKWLTNLTPVRWAVTKTKSAGAFLWRYAKGPTGAVVATLAAIFFAPKVVADMLALVVVCLVVVGFFAWKTYRAVKEAAPEEVQELVDSVNAERQSIKKDGKLQVVDEGDLNPEETPMERHDHLQTLLEDAQSRGDVDLESEIVGRMHLLEIRENLYPGPRGDHKLEKTASAPEIYRDCRQLSEKFQPHLPWNWTVMNNAVRNEDVRLREIKLLQQHQAKATKKAAPASR